MYEVKYCPYCGSLEIEFVGVTGFGSRYLCKKCKHRFVIM